MIVFYIVDLLLVLILSIGLLALVVALGFRERWKMIVGALIAAVIVIAAFFLESKMSNYYRDGAEFSKLIEQATLYLQKRNK